LDEEIRIGLITDLHHDIMHDGLDRMKAFESAMHRFLPHAVIQMGDFAVPKPENQPLVDLFHQLPGHSFHILGNHDTDGGYSPAQCLRQWNLSSSYYREEVAGLTLLVLDGNESGSPTFKRGYPSFMGEVQVDWLRAQLEDSEGPVLIMSHQPLAGTIAIDNALEIQQLLTNYNQKIVAAICGHSHTDQLIRVVGVTYIHLNSASYYWVGGAFRHQSYPEAIHKSHPWISSTCPYQEVLFAELTLDPKKGKFNLMGRRTAWVGPSPAEVGLRPFPDALVGEQIHPVIRNRSFYY